MTHLPLEIEKFRDEQASIDLELGNPDYAYDRGFNAGFAAFRDSEMQKELLEKIEHLRMRCHFADSQREKEFWVTADNVIRKYRKWVNDDKN